MLDGGSESLIRLARVSGNLAFRVLLLYTVPFGLMAIYGLFRLAQTNRQLMGLSLLIITYFVFFSAGPEFSARFRVPFVPLYVLLCSFGISGNLTAPPIGVPSRRAGAPSNGPLAGETAIRLFVIPQTFSSRISASGKNS